MDNTVEYAGGLYEWSVLKTGTEPGAAFDGAKVLAIRKLDCPTQRLLHVELNAKKDRNWISEFKSSTVSSEIIHEIIDGAERAGWVSDVEGAPFEYSFQYHDYYEIVSEATRPDGKYTIALALDQDPDFPELWLIDRVNQCTSRLEAKVTEIPEDADDPVDEGYGIINWPGEKIFWDDNNFVVRAFDRLNGYSTFMLFPGQGSFRWEGSRHYPESEIATEDWWVDTTTTKGSIRWLRQRVFTDGVTQSFYGGPSAYYDYYPDARTFERTLSGSYRRSETLIPPDNKDDDDLLVKMTEVTPPDTLYYEGPSLIGFGELEHKGLPYKASHPNYVHLTDKIETAASKVLFKGKAVLLGVNAGLMHLDGHIFHRTIENVWLTELVPPDYIDPIDISPTPPDRILDILLSHETVTKHFSTDSIDVSRALCGRQLTLSNSRYTLLPARDRLAPHAFRLTNIDWLTKDEVVVRFCYPPGNMYGISVFHAKDNVYTMLTVSTWVGNRNT